MNTSLNISPSTHGQGVDDAIFSRIAGAIAEKGYIILHDVFPAEYLQSLFCDIKETDSSCFHNAGIGRDQAHHLNRFVRGDRIRWLDRTHQPVQFYLEWTEQLRQYLNRALFLGLFDYESHFAHYPKGTFYKKHVDAFKGVSNRVLTTILYLNPLWNPEDGGELVLYEEDSTSVQETVLPVAGTMVLFLSEVFPHEVLPANRSRYSLTGWFRVNNTNSSYLDPSR